jgi:L-fuconolactonase
MSRSILGGKFMLFDCHAHLIADDPRRYPPAPLSGQLRPDDLENPMTAERLLREMDANSVERAVVVQRSHVYGFDNSYVCDAAAAFPDRLKAVVSINAVEPTAAAAVRHWIGERGAVGIRMMEPFKGADTSWFASEQARAAWVAATELGAPVCVHFFRWNRSAGLPALHKMLQDFPTTTVVVDHFSNMACEAGPPDYGLDTIFADIAKFPCVYTKFTTIPLGQLQEQKIDAAPLVKRVVATFGASRVMWGSDIAQSRGTYEYMVGLAHAATRSLSPTEKDQVLHGATAAVYGGG